MTSKDWQSHHDQIADRLRAIRTAAGLSGKALADLNRWPASKVSRLESGQYRATAEDIQQWVSACAADPTAIAELNELLSLAQDGYRDWKRRLRRGSAAVQLSHNQLVSQSARICHFETAYVPGLIQTAEYAQHVLYEGITLANGDPGDVPAAVATRLQRQQMLYEPGKQFEFLLCEAVLRYLPVPPAAMRAQLDRIIAAATLPNVRFGILPFGVPLKLVPQNSFQLYDDVATVETFAGEWSYRDEDSGVYARVFELLWKDAFEGTHARSLITRAIEMLPT